MLLTELNPLVGQFGVPNQCSMKHMEACHTGKTFCEDIIGLVFLVSGCKPRIHVEAKDTEKGVEVGAGVIIE